MELITNNWSKGMMSDEALTVEQNATALRMENLRVITSTGATTFAITNIKGTSTELTFPITSSVNYISYSGLLTVPITLTLVINGNTDTISFTAGQFGTTLALYEAVATFINTSAIFQATDTYLAYGQSDQVILYSTTFLNNIGLFTASANWTTTIAVPSLGNFQVLGWTTIRDTIVLLTCSNVFQNPGGHDPNLPPDPNGDGQIWTITYDINDVPTITLIYNNLIDFTPYHDVPSPGAIVGRYETGIIQRIYWTDNFNQPRHLNIADPNAFGTPILGLLNQAEVTTSLPILQEIVTGVLPAGMYQYAFRLKKANGAKTTFSPPSNFTFAISFADTSAPYFSMNYTVPGTVTSKGFKYKIRNLDTDYDRIEVAYLYYDTADTQAPVCNIFLDTSIPSNGELNFIHTGTEPLISVSLEEFTDTVPIIERVKTIVSKDNRLFYGNIIENKLRVNYDARAYRYDANGASYFGAGNPDDINPNQSPIPHEQGFIFQDPVQAGGLVYGGTGVNISYTFIPDNDDITLLTPEALTCQTVLDDRTMFGPVPYRQYRRDSYLRDLIVDQYPHVNTYRSTGEPYTTAVRGYQRDEIYRFGIVFFDKLGCPSYVNWIGDIRMPHPWMPDNTSAANAVLDSQRKLKFPPTGLVAGTALYNGYPLGIKFTVNIPQSLKTIVSGYSIVRVHRDSVDKTILGQGLLQTGWKDQDFVTNGNVYLTDEGIDPGNKYGGGLQSQVTLGYNSAFTKFIVPDDVVGSLHIPEQLFDIESFSIATNDAIDFVGLVETANVQGTQLDFAFSSSTTAVNSGGGHATGYVLKNYIYKSGATPKIFFNGGADYEGTMQLSATINVEPWNLNQTSSGSITRPITGGGGTTSPILNISPPFSPGARTDSYSQGPKRLMFAGADITGSGGLMLSTRGLRTLYDTNNPSEVIISIANVPGGDTSTVTSIAPIGRQAIFNYKRQRLNQYGGNTVSARSNNIYMPTGHFQPLVDTTPPVNTARVFGGDTYVQAFETVPRKAHWNTSSDGYGWSAATTDKVSRVLFTVLETTVNTELRNDPNTEVANKSYFPDNGSAMDVLDDFDIEPLYQRDKQIVAYIPEPQNLTLLSEFDTRIRGSEQKENGEFSDSWGIFKASTYIDVEGIYGPLNNLLIDNNAMLFFQDKAFGNVEVNTRAALQTTTGETLAIGTAGLLSRFDYISTEVGCRHQWGMIKGGKGIYFFDSFKKKLYRYEGKGLSSLGELKGMSGFFNTNFIGSGLTNDNPVLRDGPSCTYDFKFNEVWFTYHTQVHPSFTIVYSELIDAFQCFISSSPMIYINDKRHILSTTNTFRLYRHDAGDYCQYHDAPVADSKLSFVINPHPGLTKKFDVHTWNTNVVDETTNADVRDTTWTRSRDYDTFQNNGFLDFITKPQPNFNVARNRNREWFTHIRRNALLTAAVNVDVLDPVFLDNTQINKPRMYDNYIISDFEFDNSNNYKFICPYISTGYRGAIT